MPTNKTGEILILLENKEISEKMVLRKEKVKSNYFMKTNADPREITFLFLKVFQLIFK